MGNSPACDSGSASRLAVNPEHDDTAAPSSATRGTLQVSRGESCTRTLVNGSVETTGPVPESLTAPTVAPSQLESRPTHPPAVVATIDSDDTEGHFGSSTVSSSLQAEGLVMADTSPLVDEEMAADGGAVQDRELDDTAAFRTDDLEARTVSEPLMPTDVYALVELTQEKSVDSMAGDSGHNVEVVDMDEHSPGPASHSSNFRLSPLSQSNGSLDPLPPADYGVRDLPLEPEIAREENTRRWVIAGQQDHHPRLPDHLYEDTVAEGQIRLGHDSASLAASARLMAFRRNDAVPRFPPEIIEDDMELLGEGADQDGRG